jgi:hypothetical protein
MNIPNYQVAVVGPYDSGSIGLYDVQEWKVKGDHLVPIYCNGMTPADEPPMNTVTLVNLDDTTGPSSACDETVRAEGQNNVLVCTLGAGHDGDHRLVAV